MSLRSRLAGLFPVFDGSANIKGVIDGLDDELDHFDGSIGDVQDSIRINSATGQSLDLIGDSFGPLGRRRDRSDDELRQLLKSIGPAFDGRGTTDDVELAIAAGLAVEKGEVELNENFGANEYEVVLNDWSSHSTATIRDMAELSDPVGVDRVDPVHNILENMNIGVSAGETQINSGSESETAAIGIDFGNTQPETTNSSGTFGTSTFDGENTFS